MTASRLRLPLAAALVLSAGVAEAHTGAAHVHSLAEGLTHPLTGADHLLAMVAVGLIAARGAGRVPLAVPAGFVAAMAAGAALGMAGLGVGFAETGIALSLLVLGALATLSRPLPVTLTAAIAALSGLAHGLAHGAEAPADGASLGYLAGMLATTAILHAAGFTAGRWAAGGRAVRIATGVAAVGLGAMALVGAV